MDPKLSVNKGVIQETPKISLSSLSFPGKTLVMSAVMSAMMFSSEAQAQQKTQEGNIPSAGAPAKADPQTIDVIEKLNSGKGLTPEKAQEIVKNQDIYVDLLLKSLKQHGIESEAGYAIMTRLADKITSPKFQKGLIELLPKKMDDYNHPHVIFQICSSGIVDSDVLKFMTAQLHTENAKAIISGLINIKDSEQQKIVFQDIKDYAERTGDSKATKFLLDKLPSGEKEKYYLYLADKLSGTNSEISYALNRIDYSNPKIVDHLVKIIGSPTQKDEMQYLGYANTEYATKALITMLENPKLRLSALVNILPQTNDSAKSFLTNPNIDFSTWTAEELKLLKREKTLSNLNSESLKNLEKAELQVKTRKFLTETTQENKLVYYDELEAEFKKQNKPNQTFNDFLLEQLDPVKDQKIIQTFKSALEIGIDNPSRFKPEILEKLISARKSPDFSNGKYALVIAPKVEADGTFQNMPEVEELLKQGYKVLYYEAGNDNTDLSKIADECKLKKLQADAMFILGHGSSDAIALGSKKFDAEKIDPKDEALFIDLSDVKELQKIGFDSLIKPGQPIISGGCHNAAGKENLQKTLQTIFPEHTVLGAEKNYLYAQLIFEDGKITGVKFIYPEDLK